MDKDRKAKKHAYYLANKGVWNKGQNTDEYRAKARAYNKRIRLETIRAYGGKCDCCNENRYEFLAIDHVNGGGIKHRKDIGNAGNSIAKWLRKQGYPKGYRVLCHNCNCAIGFYKLCPHKKGQEDDKEGL
jgi:hypothetical protein